MTEQEHLLVCLMEEAAEVQQACAKALRFGLDDTYRKDTAPDGAPAWTMTPREEIRHELNDMLGVQMLLHAAGVILSPGSADYEAAHRKRAKVLRMMEYARSQGTLEPDGRAKEASRG